MSLLKSQPKFNHIDVKEDQEFLEIINDEDLIIETCNINSETLQKLKELLNNTQNEKEKQDTIEIFLGFVYLKLREKFLEEEQQELKQQIENIEQGNVNYLSNTSYSSYRKKRIRKKKTDIARLYKCLCKTCPKSYGSENSMNQHMKIKHPEFWKDLKNQEMRIFKQETIYFDKNQQGGNNLTDLNNNIDNNDKDGEPINFDIES